MKLWIDECLSPTLVERVNHRGYWAACNRDRDLLGASDSVLHEVVIGEDIEEKAKAADEPTADRMLNKQVEVDPEGATKHGDLPRPE